MTQDEKQQKTDKVIDVLYEILEKNKEKEGVKKAFSEIRELKEKKGL